LYCNRQVHRDFLITLYIHVQLNKRILIECNYETRLRQEQTVVWKTCTLKWPER
jgi:hypothetical protein